MRTLTAILVPLLCLLDQPQTCYARDAAVYQIKERRFEDIVRAGIAICQAETLEQIREIRSRIPKHDNGKKVDATLVVYTPSFSKTEPERKFSAITSVIFDRRGKVLSDERFVAELVPKAIIPLVQAALVRARHTRQTDNWNNPEAALLKVQVSVSRMTGE